MKKENIILIALGLLGVGYFIYLKSKKNNPSSNVDATGTPAPSTPYQPLNSISVNAKTNPPAEDIYKVKFSLGKIPNTI
jgi:flagellar basal body-associated protein FliL